MSDLPVTFSCNEHRLLGMLHLPTSPPSMGLVLIVGGPQYRVGSHRQFVLMARHLAACGVAVLRFDCRGMGDSEGDFPGFEAIGPDIAAAVNFFLAEVSSLKQIALWGLCDAASAICFYAASDPRIAGLALLNPWIRSEAGYARTQLKHYYLARLTQKDFLQKVVTGKFDLRASAKSLSANIRKALSPKQPDKSSPANPDISRSDTSSIPIADRMAIALAKFDGKILLVMSGRDLTAKEFDGAATASRKWRRILSGDQSCRRDFADADHTFSRRHWRDQVAKWTEQWLKELPPSRLR